MNQSYDDHIDETLDDVKSGQHLRFMNPIYRTKEVCLAAVDYESTHSEELNDFYSVPMGNLDYVMKNMREKMKNNSYYLERLEEAYLKKKEQEKLPGYYGEFETYQDKLNHYKVDNHDDMLCKMYDFAVEKL